MLRHITRWSLLTVLLFFVTTGAIAASITGAGSSAAAPLYTKWAGSFQKISGMDLEYQTLGSSAGIKLIKEKKVDFGASDVAMKKDQLDKDGLIQFPSAISGVVPIINLPGIKAGDLRLSGDVLADIFARKITSWNDPRLVTLNPTLRLPNKPIEVIVRSDGSGSTYNFTDYLSKVSPEWKQVYKRNFSIAWHKDLNPVKGSSGVVAALKKTNYSISYVDFNYVVQDNLDFALLKNHDGNFVAPTAESFSASLIASNWKMQGNFDEMLTNKEGKFAWPITMGTFIIMQKNAMNSERSIAVLKFFTWAFMSGDRLVRSVDLVRLPDNLQARAFKEMTNVKASDGSPLRWAMH